MKRAPVRGPLLPGRTSLCPGSADTGWGVRHALGEGASCASEKTAATCRSLLEGETHLWTFLRVPKSSRRLMRPSALRHAVLWRKMSGGTASEWGSRFVKRGPVVAATCRQQGRNVLEYLTGCFRAQVNGSPLPSLLVSSDVSRLTLVAP